MRDYHHRIIFVFSKFTPAIGISFRSFFFDFFPIYLILYELTALSHIDREKLLWPRSSGTMRKQSIYFYIYTFCNFLLPAHFFLKSFCINFCCCMSEKHFLWIYHYKNVRPAFHRHLCCFRASAVNDRSGEAFLEIVFFISTDGRIEMG